MSARCRVSLLAALSLLAGSTMLTPALAKDGDSCAGSRDLRLVNGKIHTLDANNSIVSSLRTRETQTRSISLRAFTKTLLFKRWRDCGH